MGRVDSACGQRPSRQLLEKSKRTMQRPGPRLSDEVEVANLEGQKLARPPNGDWETFLKSSSRCLR